MSSQLYGPANTPIFNPAPTRAPNKIVSPALTGGGGLAELPPFNFGGIIRNQFSIQMRSGVYVPTAAVTLGEIEWTLVAADKAGFGQGPIFSLQVNGVAVYTSARCVATGGLAAVNIPVAADSRVFVRIDDDGRGSAIGLTVMCRLA